MTNEQILSQIVNEQEREVFKSMRTDMNSAGALLNPEQFNQFMRAAIINQTILNDASFRKMNAMQQVVSSTKVVGRVLQNGYDSTGATEDQLKAATIGFGKAELNSTKLKALTGILDDDKEDNIEQAQFEQTLLTMMGEAVGVDLEALCVFGDDSYTSGSPAAKDPLFSTFAMINEMPVAYRQANLMKDLVFYVPWEVKDAYHDFLIDRETGLGDSSLLNNTELQYKGIPVKYAPVLDAVDGRTVHGAIPSMLTVPEFLWYGVYRDLSVEPDRIVAQELTNYYYRIRCAASLQWADSLIVADCAAADFE